MPVVERGGVKRNGVPGPTNDGGPRTAIDGADSALAASPLDLLLAEHLRRRQGLRCPRDERAKRSWIFLKAASEISPSC